MRFGRYRKGARAFNSSNQGRTTAALVNPVPCNSRERPMFIRFRELRSARRNALLQLSKPVQHNLDLCSGRRGCCLFGVSHVDEPLPVRCDVTITNVDVGTAPATVGYGHWEAEPD